MGLVFAAAVLAVTPVTCPAAWRWPRDLPATHQRLAATMLDVWTHRCAVNGRTRWLTPKTSRSGRPRTPTHPTVTAAPIPNATASPPTRPTYAAARISALVDRAYVAAVPLTMCQHCSRGRLHHNGRAWTGTCHRLPWDVAGAVVLALSAVPVRKAAKPARAATPTIVTPAAKTANAIAPSMPSHPLFGPQGSGGFTS